MTISRDEDLPDAHISTSGSTRQSTPGRDALATEAPGHQTVETRRNVLLSPYTLGDLPLRNRVVMAALTRCRATNPEAVPTPLMTRYYEQRASAGLIISEGTWVSAEAKGWRDAPGVFTPRQRDGWASVVDAVHNRGGLMLAQLWHQGAVSLPDFHGGHPPMGPSAVNPEQIVHAPDGLRMTGTPNAMTREDIRRTVADFRNAARVAREAGFDGVQIQAGFIYLIAQFMHETTNTRSDEYGGPVANRARLLFEVLEAVLEEWPSQRVGIKTGAVMRERGAFVSLPTTTKLTEYVFNRLNDYDLSHLLVMRPVADLTDSPTAHLAGDGVVRHARSLYRGTLMVTGVHGPEHGASLIEDGLADLVAFGRPFIANPDLPERISAGAPLTAPEPDYFYSGGSRGYTDYPTRSGMTQPRA